MCGPASPIWIKRKGFQILGRLSDFFNLLHYTQVALLFSSFLSQTFPFFIWSVSFHSVFQPDHYLSVSHWLKFCHSSCWASVPEFEINTFILHLNFVCEKKFNRSSIIFGVHLKNCLGILLCFHCLCWLRIFLLTWRQNIEIYSETRHFYSSHILWTFHNTCVNG